MKTFCCLLFLVGFSTLGRPVFAADKPNIVVILSDDYGYGSSGCYGGPVQLKTPNLDRLAREGRRFTQAYATGSVCSPTRYGMMTGRYYWRTSIKDGEVLPGNAPLHIETGRLTLASLCQSQGYRTGAFGKWHLGLGAEARRLDWSGSLKPGPLEIGFDTFFGLAANPWNGPHYYIENHDVIGKVAGQPVVLSGNRDTATTAGLKEQWQNEDIMPTLTAKVTGWIEQNSKGPFFLYYAPNAVHEPVAPEGKFTGSPYGKYGDFIAELDWSVGQVLATLDRLKLTDNTLLIFTSDNGGVVNENNPNASAAIKAGLAINGALKGGKHSFWEGGFREPFLVRWPGKVPANTVSDQVICLTDVLATLASVLKAPLPAGAHAEDSLDVSRAFFESKPGKPVRDHVILQAADATYAIRQGDWKLIEHVAPPKFEHRNKNAEKKQAKKRAPTADELYNLRTDPAETKDVHADNAELVVKLRKLLADDRDRGRTR